MLYIHTFYIYLFICISLTVGGAYLLYVVHDRDGVPLSSHRHLSRGLHHICGGVVLEDRVKQIPPVILHPTLVSMVLVTKISYNHDAIHKLQLLIIHSLLSTILLAKSTVDKDTNHTNQVTD